MSSITQKSSKTKSDAGDNHTEKKQNSKMTQSIRQTDNSAADFPTNSIPEPAAKLESKSSIDLSLVVDNTCPQPCTVATVLELGESGASEVSFGEFIRLKKENKLLKLQVWGRLSG